MGFLLLSCILFVLCSFLRFKIIERKIPLNFVQTIFAQCKAEKRHASARSAPAIARLQNILKRTVTST